MSDQDIIDTIAVAVGRHEYWQLLVSEDWECACGETALFKVEMDQHIASTIAAALRERYEIRPISDGEPTYDDRGKFTGWTKRRCGEHRTVGDRARCHDCHDWCYPDKELACDGCRIADAAEADQ